MVQKLEATKGAPGSVRVGSTGTVSVLMTKELESVKAASEVAVSCRGKTSTIPVSISCGDTIPKRLQARKSLDEASGSGSSSNVNRRSPETPRKLKNYTKSAHRVPILGSDNITLERSPHREKSEKKTINIVEVVDIKCGNPEKDWASPITSKLKKLGFSKLSESII